MVLNPYFQFIKLLLADERVNTQKVTISENSIILDFQGVINVLLRELARLLDLSDRCLQVVCILAFDTLFIVSLGKNPSHFPYRVKVTATEPEHYSLKEVYLLRQISLFSH